MIFLLAGQFVLLLGLVWLLDHRRHDEVVTIHGLLEMHDKEREQHLDRISNLIRAQHEAMTKPHPDLESLIGLVDRLCQRLQAPEQAVVDHSIQLPDPPVPPTVSMFDDKGYWEAMGIPKEQLAEDLMSQEVNGS